MSPNKKNLSLFSVRLKESRESKGMKQQVLAEILDIEPATLSRYENIPKEKDASTGTSVRKPKVYPTLDLVCKMADALGVSLDWLCGISEDAKTSDPDDLILMRIIADVIEGKNKNWKILVENDKPKDSLHLGIVFTCSEIFEKFYKEYKAAYEAGPIIIKNGVEEDVVDTMKKTVFEKHLNALRKYELFPNDT
jgi:transcriptional regulator with XRE-family HTH domain